MVYLAEVFSDIEKEIEFPQDTNDSADVRAWLEMLFGESFSSLERIDLYESTGSMIVAFTACNVKNEKDINFIVTLQCELDEEAMIKGDCILCKESGGALSAFTETEKTTLHVKLAELCDKIKQVNEKAEKDSVKAMKKLCQ